MNNFLKATHPHPSKQISDAIAGDPMVINLTVGEPAFGPPNRMLDAVATLVAQRGEDPAPSYNRYAHSSGLPVLRNAIAKRYHNRYGLAVDPETQVLVTHGAAEAIWLTIFTLTNSGDEVIIPDPCYMLYEPITVCLGRQPVRLQTSVNRGFCLDPADLRRVITKRTRLLLLNSPENPTGAVYDRATLAAITSLAGEYKFYIMHDEVFDDFAYGGEHTPALALDPTTTRTIMVNSFSKRFGMTGWRLGWLVAAPEVVKQAAKAHTYISLATGTMLQEAAATILNDSSVGREVAERAVVLRERSHRFLRDLLALDGFTCPAGPPKGGFYLFVCVADLHRELALAANDYHTISESTARYLLETCKVAVVPGTGFGAAGEGYVRISFAAPEAHLTAALDRFRRMLH